MWNTSFSFAKICVSVTALPTLSHLCRLLISVVTNIVLIKTSDRYIDSLYASHTAKIDSIMWTV
jgi:hypothetical protein